MQSRSLQNATCRQARGRRGYSYEHPGRSHARGTKRSSFFSTDQVIKRAELRLNAFVYNSLGTNSMKVSPPFFPGQPASTQWAPTGKLWAVPFLWTLGQMYWALRSCIHCG